MKNGQEMGGREKEIMNFKINCHSNIYCWESFVNRQSLEWSWKNTSSGNKRWKNNEYYDYGWIVLPSMFGYWSLSTYWSIHFEKSQVRYYKWRINEEEQNQ